jgi:hypothetical protein
MPCAFHCLTPPERFTPLGGVQQTKATKAKTMNKFLIPAAIVALSAGIAFADETVDEIIVDETEVVEEVVEEADEQDNQYRYQHQVREENRYQHQHRHQTQTDAGETEADGVGAGGSGGAGGGNGAGRS